MIGLDTNVLVRYVTQDDPVQSAKASDLIESLTTLSPGFVSLVSVVELVWVFRAAINRQSAKSALLAVKRRSACQRVSACSIVSSRVRRMGHRF